MKNPLRWLLVLPAAMLGFVMAQVITIAVTFFLPDVASRLVSSVVTPMGFVVLGARVAPYAKLHCAAVLTLLVVTLQGVILGAALFSGWYTMGETSELLMATGLGAGGAVAGVYLVYLNERSGIGQARVASQEIG